MSLVATSSILVVNTIIDEKTSSAAEIHARDIANKISDAIINVCLFKENYPSANYSTTVDIPYQLIDYFNYYIELNNNFVFINSTDGLVNVKNSLYNCSGRIGWDIQGRVDGADKLVISCNSSNYVYKFDFGTSNSSSAKGYTRISENCDNSVWYTTSGVWKYRVPIFVSNPLSEPIDDYAVLIQLKDKNFNHILVNENLSDIRFFDDAGSELYYWIENWYSDTTKTSRIWVNVSSIPVDGCMIHMYFGRSADSSNQYHDGSKTFLFFDNFSKNTMNKWDLYYYNADSRINIMDGSLVLKNGAAVISKTYINPDSTPYILETKSKSISETEIGQGYDNPIEASIFARKTNGSFNPPYHHASVFSSGTFEYRPTDAHYFDNAIVYYQDGKWNNYTDYETQGINQGWYRLKYILNHSDDVAARYFYDNFVLDGEPKSISYRGTKDGAFGLCIANTEYIDEDFNITAYYDWIFARKFVSNPNAVSSREESEPIAYVGAVQSEDYGWDTASDNILSKSSGGTGVGDDLVYSNDNNVHFEVNNLSDSKYYSIFFTIGDYDTPQDIEGMSIDITHSEGTELLSFSDCSENIPHKKRWISNLQTASGDFIFSFSSSNKWAINEITIMEGERIIWLEGKN